MKKVIFLFLLITSFGYTQNTLHYNDEKGSEKATLKDISWLAGNWKGEAFGGQFEENWSKPSAGSMLFNFKLVTDGKVIFYELGQHYSRRAYRMNTATFWKIKITISQDVCW